jgi:hypothetical protein
MRDFRSIDCPGICCLGSKTATRDAGKERKMKEQLESYAARIAAQIQTVGAEVDPDILQLPGGSVIATILWLYSKGAVAFRKH